MLSSGPPGILDGMAKTEVTFVVEEGDVWIDPEGIAWKVVRVDAFIAYLERSSTNSVDMRNMVRTWRKMGDTHPNHTYPSAPKHVNVGTPI